MGLRRTAAAVIVGVVSALLSPSERSYSTSQRPSQHRPPAVLFSETPGELEFSGRLIARPDQALMRRPDGGAAARDAVHLAIEAFTLIEHVAATDEYLLAPPEGVSENDAAAELLATGLFQYVEPDWICYPASSNCPNDPRLDRQWHHATNIMQSCEGWALFTGDPGVTVAICDTGVRVTHQDLLLHRKPGYNAVDRLWEGEGGQITDINGHGTGVLGAAAANGNNGVGVSGVGWNLGHRMMRITNSQAGGSSISTITHAARTAVENGDRVASVSYAGTTTDTARTTATYIKSKGGLLVWAAGNGGSFLHTDRDADDLIVVGATNPADERWINSNYGSYVDLFAPGDDIHTTTNGGDRKYGSPSGTSYAAPLVAGLIGLIWSAEPTLTPDEVEHLLKQGCDDLGAPGVDSVFGYGRINVYKTLRDSVAPVLWDYPDGFPAIIDPTGGTSMRVTVSPYGYTGVEGTARLHYHDGVQWRSTLMPHLGGNLYQAVFPPLPCGSVTRYYFSIRIAMGVRAYDPPEAPDRCFIAPVVREPVFVDLFETDRGWTVSSDTLLSGQWERGVPAGDGSRGDPPTDSDGSGQCYLTGNAPGNSDVDGGPTRLFSPILDLSGGLDYHITYARWFTTDRPGDWLRVHISNDGGDTWTLVERVGNGAGWQTTRFRVADVIAPTSQVMLRFQVADQPDDSITEAAIDAFMVLPDSCRVVTTSLTNAVVTRGTLVSGSFVDLIVSDNVALRARSAPEEGGAGVHSMYLRVDAQTDAVNPSDLDVRIETRIDDVAAAGKVMMRNWVLNRFEEVASYAVGLDEVVIDVKGLNGATYVRASDGRLQVQLRHTAAVLLFGSSFDTWVDHVRIVVRE